MVLKSVLALALALGASAIQVTNPTNTTVWKTEGSEIIEWNSVNTDPTSLNIQLVDPSKPNEPITIAENVETSSKSYAYTPSSYLTAGDDFRINIVSSTSQAGILAQSPYFSVEQGTSSVSASASSSTSSMASTSVSVSQSSASGAATSSAAASAASASHSNGAGMILAPTGLLAFVAAAVGVLA